MAGARIAVETARFDTQKIVNPEISGAEYQQGTAMRSGSISWKKGAASAPTAERQASRLRLSTLSQSQEAVRTE
ncbi:MAG: RRXRR domain-containing protein [Bacillota bacterium]